MKKLLLVGILAVAILLTVFYSLFPSDERKIKRLFKEAASAFEKEDIDGLMKNVSFNYRDEYGFTYLYLKEFFKRIFSTYSDLKVEHENIKVKVLKDSAMIDVDIRIIGTLGEETGYIAGDIKTPLHCIFALEKEKFKWLVVKSEITNFRDGGGAGIRTPDTADMSRLL